MYGLCLSFYILLTLIIRHLVHFTFEVVITQYLLVLDFERPKIDRSSEPQVKRPDDGSKKEMNLDRTRTYNIRTFLNIHEMGSTNNILKLH